MRAVIILIASAGYSGYVPVAPGTAGAAVGLFFVWLFFAPLWQASLPLFFVVFSVLFAIACWISNEAEKIFEQHDSPHIVIDEVFGMAATVFLLHMTWQWMLAGFLLFRILDVVKPYPANLIDRRMTNGAGVMLDDLVSGIYANIMLQIAHRVLG